MQITIIDRSFEVDKNLTQGKLLWAVITFAKVVNWTSMAGGLIAYAVPATDLTENYKVGYYKTLIKGWETDMKPETLEMNYRAVLEIKKMKHKNKNSLIALHKWNNIMESLHKESLRYINHLEKQFHIEELHNFFSLPQKGVLPLFHFDEYKSDDYSYVEIEMLTTTILNNYETPLFSNEVENFTTVFDNTTSQNLDNNSIFKMKLIEFISPASLTFNKLEIIRSELVPVFEPLAAFIDDSNTKLINQIFNPKLFNEQNDFMINHISSEISKTQNAINDNLYFNQIQNSVEEPETFTLYLCAASIDTILNLYHKVSEMPIVTVNHAKDELSKKINLESTKLFLYLKTNKL